MKINSWFLAFLSSCFVLTAVYSQYGKDDWKKRDTWMDTPKLFQYAQIDIGSVVADVGCHEGYLSIRLAKKVGQTGKVYAVDVREDRLRTLKENMAFDKLSNIEIILGDYDDPKLPTGVLNAIFVIDTYHEIDDYKAMLTHLKKSLIKGGRLLILEKLKEHAKDESREVQVAAHTLSLKYVKEELLASGFRIVHEIGNFGKWNQEADKTMWVLVGVNDSD
ncbi:MAG: methyltransferase domain-containing protein [Maribacter sp.]|nr:methyltransferase domain-containing protein [Maribacter sp.]